jgi:C_GCAxxG_C_C family probable redox protein
MSEKTALAATYHEPGYGRTQAVLASFSKNSGLGEETALRLSTGFGSGMGRMCEVCGALTGVFMVIGLRYGKVVTDGNKNGTDTKTTYRVVAELAGRFEARGRSILCRDRIGHYLGIPVERDKVREQGLFRTTCGKCVQDAVELLEEVL